MFQTFKSFNTFKLFNEPIRSDGLNYLNRLRAAFYVLFVVKALLRIGGGFALTRST